MECVYCGHEMCETEHGMDGYVETSVWEGIFCNSVCNIREDSDDVWEEPEPLCDTCSVAMELEDTLDNNISVYICPECSATKVLEPVSTT